jgi:hypothetical protein
MKTLFALIAALALAGCSTLGLGNVAGNSTITLLCPDGKSTVTYVSGTVIPQTNPIVASCTVNGIVAVASVSGIDLNSLLAVAAAAAPLAKGQKP